MNRRSTLATGLLLAGSLLLLAGDSVQVVQGGGMLWTILLWLAFVCFGAGLLLLPMALSLTDRPLVTIGVASAFVGSFAGASMQVLFRTWSVLEVADQPAMVELLRSNVLLTVSTLAPGLFFPLGLLALSIGLMRARVLPLWITLTLAVGAILFPIGHAAAVVPALILGDVVLVAAFFGLFLHTPGARTPLRTTIGDPTATKAETGFSARNGANSAP